MTARGVRIGSVALLVAAFAVGTAAFAAPAAAAGTVADAGASHEQTDTVVDVDDLTGQSYWTGTPLEIDGFDAGELAEVGDEWVLEYGVGPENDHRVDDGTQPITARTGVTVEEPTTQFAGEFDEEDRLVVENGDESEISVETNLAPGTEGDVYVETRDATHSTDVVVDEDGRATATFDFSANEPGDIADTIEATLFGAGGDRSSVIEGRFVPADGPPMEVTASAPEETVDGSTTVEATVRNVGLQTDVAEVSVTADGDEVSSFAVELEPGETWSGSYQVDVGPGETNWSVESQTDSVEGAVEPVEAVWPTSDGGSGASDAENPRHRSRRPAIVSLTYRRNLVAYTTDTLYR